MSVLAHQRPSSRAAALDFADVVHQTEQLPLRRHLVPPAMTEAIEPMRAANVRKHRLHDPEASTVPVPSELAVDLTLHPGTVGFGFALAKNARVAWAMLNQHACA